MNHIEDKIEKLLSIVTCCRNSYTNLSLYTFRGPGSKSIHIGSLNSRIYEIESKFWFLVQSIGNTRPEEKNDGSRN